MTKGGVSEGARMLIPRDIPVSCTCMWAWDAARFRWVRTRLVPGCIWHGA